MSDALAITALRDRFHRVRDFRLGSSKKATVAGAAWSHRFDERKPLATSPVICVPVTSSENRPYLPIGLLPAGTALSNSSFGMPVKQVWTVALIASRLNLVLNVNGSDAEDSWIWRKAEA
ncbi:type IIL restriction-modification enzyme MmeI [Paragemmobacter kunshanensis]|uniref:type IIL restriction-modification enzyme MmeI n=1 Tax=Paragemmobacter kunshanensis TaxID=2583234 RepID=UPI003313082F